MAANYIPASKNCVQMPHKALQLKTPDWDPEAMHVYKALTSDLVHIKEKKRKLYPRLSTKYIGFKADDLWR